MICPCRIREATQQSYEQCCQIKHENYNAKTPEELMRSRYSAFYLGLGEYIFNTHHQDFRKDATVSDYQQSAENTDWVGLDVVKSAGEQVEFKAYFIDNGQLHQLHEISNFVMENNQWFYTDGNYQPRSSLKISRNDPCPCSSGKKAKKCHLL